MNTTCRYCLAPVEPKARKCKSCGEWLTHLNNKSIAAIAWLFFIVALMTWIRFASNAIMAGREFSRSVSERFEILNHERVVSSDALAIIGEIKNKDATSKEMIKVEVRFYDNQNKLVDLGEDYISGDFEAGEIRPFKVSFKCGVSNNNKIHDHYEIKVRN